ncbi:MAG: hypothetical protein ACAF41_29775 [Leptolyngbya sp. BL-A-14]
MKAWYSSGQRAEGRGQRAEGRRQREAGEARGVGKQEVEGRGQRAEGKTSLSRAAIATVCLN